MHSLSTQSFPQKRPLITMMGRLTMTTQKYLHSRVGPSTATPRLTKRATRWHLSSGLEDDVMIIFYRDRCSISILHVQCILHLKDSSPVASTSIPTTYIPREVA